MVIMDAMAKGHIDLMNQPITFKNTNFTKIDYECTNIVFCQAETKPGENWIECDPAEIEKSKCKQLYIQNGVRYYGYL